MLKFDDNRGIIITKTFEKDEMNLDIHVILMEDERLVILLKYSIPILENEIHIQMKLEVMMNSKIM